MNTELTNALRKRLAKQLGRSESEIADDADLFEGLGADSLDVVEFVTGVEERYEITVTDEMLMQWKSVESIVESVEQCLREQKNQS